MAWNERTGQLAADGVASVWNYWVRSLLCPLRWRHNGHDCVSNHQPRQCLHNRLFERRSKKTSKLRVTGLCVENSPGTGEFPAQMASNAENASIWWRHHAIIINRFPFPCAWELTSNQQIYILYLKSYVYIVYSKSYADGLRCYGLYDDVMT